MPLRPEVSCFETDGFEDTRGNPPASLPPGSLCDAHPSTGGAFSRAGLTGGLSGHSWLLSAQTGSGSQGSRGASLQMLRTDCMPLFSTPTPHPPPPPPPAQAAVVLGCVVWEAPGPAVPPSPPSLATAAPSSPPPLRSPGRGGGLRGGGQSSSAASAFRNFPPARRKRKRPQRQKRGGVGAVARAASGGSPTPERRSPPHGGQRGRGRAVPRG